MEALSNGVEDYLIEGLSFKLPPGSSYILQIERKAHSGLLVQTYTSH